MLISKAADEEALAPSSPNQTDAEPSLTSTPTPEHLDSKESFEDFYVPLDSKPAIEDKPQPAPAVPKQEPPKVKKRGNYFLRHWRGDLSLPISYWVNGIIAYMALALAAGLTAGLTTADDLRLVSVGVILLYFAALAISVWQIVGTWRSASNHTERGGTAFWAVVARIILILSAANVTNFTLHTTLPQTKEFISIIAGDKRMPAYQIRVLPGGTEIEFSGGLRAGAAKELEKILAAVPQAKVLHVNSTGGRIREGEQMARLVRQHSLITYTTDECLSAATIAFIAGKERIVRNGAKIGFHAPHFPGMTSEQESAGRLFWRGIMQSAGIQQAFIDKALTTPAESMWYPTVEEMRNAGVITSQSFGERFAVSGWLLRYSSRDEIDKLFATVPAWRSLKHLEPIAYEEMILEYSAAIRAGKSESEAINRVRTITEPLVEKYLPMASDAALRSIRNVWVAVLDELKDRDSRACIAAFSTKAAGTNHIRHLSALLGGSLRTKLVDALDGVFVSASKASAPQIDAQDAEKYLVKIRGHLRRFYAEDVDLLADESEWLNHSHRVCEMLLSFYRETQIIPDERQGNLLRYLASESSTPAKPHTKRDIFDEVAESESGSWKLYQKQEQAKRQKLFEEALNYSQKSNLTNANRKP